MKLKYLAILLAAATAASPAAAQMVSAKNPQSLVSAMQAAGFQAELGAAAGEPAITSGAGGVQFKLFFENCTDGKACTTISFFTGFRDLEANLARINEWNQKNRFARAYIDAEGDPVLRMDVDLDHDGIPRANFREYLSIWGSLAPKFVAFLRAN
jgi:hypothetical protein